MEKSRIKIIIIMKITFENKTKTKIRKTEELKKKFSSDKQAKSHTRRFGHG